MLSCFSRVWLFATPWTVVHQAPLSMGILQARILQWVVMASSRGSFPHTDGSSVSWVSCIAGRFFTTSTTWEAKVKHQFSSVQFSCSVMSDSLRPHESQHARPPCPSPTPVHSDSRPLSQWCHPVISSSVVPFFSCPQPLPASESFWDFFGKNDAKAETPELWSPHTKSWLIGKVKHMIQQLF